VYLVPQALDLKTALKFALRGRTRRHEHEAHEHDLFLIFYLAVCAHAEILQIRLRSWEKLKFRLRSCETANKELFPRREKNCTKSSRN